LRISVPLKGNGIRAAKGENPNPLFAVPSIKTPIISEKATINVPKTNPLEKTTFLYDLRTEKGKTYIFKF